jgi:hypothetical protein
MTASSHKQPEDKSGRVLSKVSKILRRKASVRSFAWIRTQENKAQTAERSDENTNTARQRADPQKPATLVEFLVAGFALITLLVSQMLLSAAIHGTNYDGADGKMAQAIIRAALQFGGFFHVNNINPIQGVGSQLLPLNVWANPVYWPFPFFDRATAPDISALIALGTFATAVYIMARCFDLPVVPSAVGAQLCIVLFAPLLMILQLSTVFTLLIGNAVVYAPYLLALGLLARLEMRSWRTFCLTTLAILGLLSYSLYCDPLWFVIGGWSWAVAFAVVTFAPLRRKTIIVRCAALGCCFVLLFLSGAADYVYTLTQYTARVQFATVIDRARGADLSASALFYSPYMKYFYLAWALGWLLGIFSLRGRERLLVIAACISCIALLVYVILYLLPLSVAWRLPLPVYVEQSLSVLFLVSAVAGFWGALRATGAWVRPAFAVAMRPVAIPLSKMFCLRGTTAGQFSSQAALAMVAATIIVGIVPATVTRFTLNDSGPYTERYNEPWPDEPELGQFLADNVGQMPGRPFRGAVHFSAYDYPLAYPMTLTIDNLWVLGVPTVDEYGQLVTPQSLYFVHAAWQQNVAGVINGFWPFADPAWDIPGPSWDFFAKVLQMFGARYYVQEANEWDLRVDKAGYPAFNFPRRPLDGAHGFWRVYELPHPNVGDYSPTVVTTHGSGAEIMMAMRSPGFDFTTQAVLSTPIEVPLLPARKMQFSHIRGGLHVSGKSDGTSLVILPQQFTNCLKPRDPGVRLVRANLMMTGIVFSGRINTDIVFDYGIYTPWCRYADLADIRQLDLRIDDLRAAHLTADKLLPGWFRVLEAFRAAASALK